MLYLCQLYIKPAISFLLPQRSCCLHIICAWWLILRAETFLNLRYIASNNSISFSLSPHFFHSGSVCNAERFLAALELYRIDMNANTSDICERCLNPAERNDEDPFQANAANSPISVTFFRLVCFPAWLAFFHFSCSHLLIPFISALGLPTYITKVSTAFANYFPFIWIAFSLPPCIVLSQGFFVIEHAV